MTPRNVESRPTRATGLPADRPLDPATLWSADTERRAKAARRDAVRARKQLAKYRARNAELARELSNARDRESRLRARESDLRARLEAAGHEIARLTAIASRDADTVLGPVRLAAAVEEMDTLRPAGRHTTRKAS